MKGDNILYGLKAHGTRKTRPVNAGGIFWAWLPPAAGLLTAALLLAGFALCAGSAAAAEKAIEITNVSYDPTRELYEKFNAEFTRYWKEKTGQDVTVTQSHGGSGSQARSVIEGNRADVVTLALAYDIGAIERAGLIKAGWQDEFPGNSAPYTSIIVFLVRKGNPKRILDWDDLTRDGVGIITPNPKTSGGARWNYLAAWAFADRLYNGDAEKTETFMKKMFANVLVMDPGARGSTMTFVENGQGDVLLAWENEALLSLKDHPGDFQIVVPSVSILAEPPVAIVDEVAEENGTGEVAAEYLRYLYSDAGQELAAQNFYRPSNPDVLSRYRDIFLDVNLVKIDDPLFGGWDKAQKEHFADDGVFDRIFEN
jgi:sulfate transport system substrate-binding protein